MSRLDRIKAFHRKYRGEILISVTSTVAGGVLGTGIDAVVDAPPAEQVQIGLLVAITFLLVGLSFALKRGVAWRIKKLESQVSSLAGRAGLTEFEERRHHFAEEKHRLIEELVRTMLPDVVGRAIDAIGTGNRRIGVLIDSGTTLESFFPRLKSLGLGPHVDDAVARKLELYTNSLAGSDAFCKELPIGLSEGQLHLFGGTQVEKYRSVQGPVTLRAVESLREDFNQSGGKLIAIVTANWLLVGKNYNQLQLCSSEDGHLEFKRLLAETADYLIVVSPLGKLLRLNEVHEFNHSIKQYLESGTRSSYKAFCVDGFKARNSVNTFLLTTSRARSSSILFTHSDELSDPALQATRGYSVRNRGRLLTFDPRGSRRQQLEVEVPHRYIRGHEHRMLGIAT